MADQKYGLLPEGFVIPTVAELRDKFDAGTRAKFGASIPLGDYTVAGHTNAILAEQVGLCWEGGEAAYSSQDVDKARDAAQDAVCALTGTFRPGAASSRALETVTGDPGTVVNTGFTVAQSAGATFSSIVPVTLVALPAWSPSTIYANGDRVTANGACFQCSIGGASDIGTGPVAPSPGAPLDPVVDHLATWLWLGNGTAVGDVFCDSEDQGEIFAAAGDLSNVVTPVGGVDGAVNVEDAELGRLQGTNEELALLREAELATSAAGPADAIRSHVLKSVPGVTSCHVFFNDTDVVDADGVLPHSVEALVQGGADADIRAALLQSVVAGIRTVANGPGAVTGTTPDSEGFDQPVNFTRPTLVNIYVDVTLSKFARSYGGDAAVKTAIAKAQTLGRGIGDDAVASAIAAAAKYGDPTLNPPVPGVAGIKDVSQVLISLTPIPTLPTTIAIDSRSLAVYDTSRISVTSTDATP